MYKILRQLREEKGVSQAEVAKAIGVTRNAITNYENGKREPNQDMVRKLCKYYNTDPNELYGFN